MAAKLSLFIMARDAAKTIEACLNSALPYVDEVIIAGGGQSTDGTLQIARDLCFNWARERYGEDQNKWPDPKPYHILQLDWHDDFARARNEGWKHLTGDYALWLDADDLLVGGDKLRKNIEANPTANCFYLPYHYAEDEYGNVAITQYRERLVRSPQDWHWEGAIHENLISDPSVPLQLVSMQDVIVRHNPERNQDKGDRNLDILYRELERTEPEPNQRTLLYLFHENATRGNLREALMHANRYISRSRIDDEAYQMAYGIATTLRALRRYPEAVKAAFKAIEMAPHWPDAYFLLARIAYEQEHFLECIEWTKAGQTKPPPQTSVIIDPRDYSYWPVYFLGLAFRGLGDWEMALANLTAAAQVIPDRQILELIAEAQRNVDGQKVLNAFMTQHEHLARNDEWLKAREHFKTAPKIIEQHPAVIEAHMRTLQSTAHVEDPQIMIDFYRANPNWGAMPDATVTSESWAQHPRMAFVRKSITCDPPATILDIGSSDGFVSLPLAGDGHIVEGWDLDPRTVEVANRRAQEWGLRAHYNTGSIENVEGKYDVALALEIIEHVVDVGAFLDQVEQHASKVVLTTPFLAWEAGQITEWQKVEPKGHLRIFDLLDIEAHLSHRGRILDLYREPYGPKSAWIFASYRPRQTYAGTVTFLAPGTLEEWSPRKLRDGGLGGSETALIRLAEELFYANGDYTKSQLCTVYGRIDAPGYYNGVRYRGMESFDAGTASDVFVAWRYPEAADLPVRSGRMVLWMHDTDAGDRLSPVRAARFDTIVVLSEWHKAHMLERYPFLDADKLVVIGNGVDRERFAPSRTGNAHKREPHRVAYTSSPDRGLDVVLAAIWPKVAEQVPDAELHVYYGWQNIDTLAPDYPVLAQFRQHVANLLLDSKNVVQHGRINQAKLATELQKANVWLYPSHNFDETYCISAIEAQLAGAIPVTTNRGALAETVGAGVVIEGTIAPDNDKATEYADAVITLLLADSKELSKVRAKVRKAVPVHGWDNIASAWSSILQLNEDRPGDS